MCQTRAPSDDVSKRVGTGRRLEKKIFQLKKTPQKTRILSICPVSIFLMRSHIATSGVTGSVLRPRYLDAGSVRTAPGEKNKQKELERWLSERGRERNIRGSSSPSSLTTPTGAFLSSAFLLPDDATANLCVKRLKTTPERREGRQKHIPSHAFRVIME